MGANSQMKSARKSIPTILIMLLISATLASQVNDLSAQYTNRNV